MATDTTLIGPLRDIPQGVRADYHGTKTSDNLGLPYRCWVASRGRMGCVLIDKLSYVWDDEDRGRENRVKEGLEYPWLLIVLRSKSSILPLTRSLILDTIFWPPVTGNRIILPKSQCIDLLLALDPTCVQGSANSSQNQFLLLGDKSDSHTGFGSLLGYAYT